MTKKIKKDLKAKGFINAKVEYRRLDTHSIAYGVYLDESYKSHAWEGHYFVGEENTANSKESMIKDWGDFVNDL